MGSQVEGVQGAFLTSSHGSIGGLVGLSTSSSLCVGLKGTNFTTCLQTLFKSYSNQPQIR